MPQSDEFEPGHGLLVPAVPENESSSSRRNGGSNAGDEG